MTSAESPRWNALVEALGQRTSSDSPQRIAIVGAGAAGIELILAMQYRLANDSAISCPMEFSLIHRSEHFLEQYPERLRYNIQQKLKRRNIRVVNKFTVSAASLRSDNVIELRSTDDQTESHQYIFWCTAAKAASWPEQSGLATERGYIAINKHLQSISHPCVFAAGDVALQQHTNTPRAGVYAVRQGRVLFKNLQRALLKQTLLSYKPQRTFLSLLACGDRTAVGCRPNSFFPTLSGKWVWRWKDRIDQQFMNMFSEFPEKDMHNHSDVPKVIRDSSPDVLPTPEMRCGGCGAKVGARILSRVIRNLNPAPQEGLILGLHSGDDASAFIVPQGKVLVQSVDVFRALMGVLDDPYCVGKIAAEHALSDLFAMNAAPHSAQAIVSLPFAAEAIVERDLTQLMAGAISVLNLHGCALSGGHTSEGSELSIGFSVNGLADENTLLTKTQVQAGHQLILTQALGTGCLFAAHAQLKAQGIWIEEARKGMLQSNRQAAAIFAGYDTSACTDITGFGLAGHLVEMLKKSRLTAQLNLSTLPALAGAIECLNAGLNSSLHQQNARFESEIEAPDGLTQIPRYPLLFDPQTSGGLLACVPTEHSPDCLTALQHAGYADAVIIGQLTDNRADASSNCSLQKQIQLNP